MHIATMSKAASNRSCDATVHTPAALPAKEQLAHIHALTCQAEDVVESRSDREAPQGPQTAPSARLREPTRVWLLTDLDKSAAIVPYVPRPPCQVDDMFGLTIIGRMPMNGDQKPGGKTGLFNFSSGEFLRSASFVSSASTDHEGG